MKKITGALIAIILIGFVIFQTNQERIINIIVERVMTANFSANLLSNIPDGLHVVLCGAGSPMPDPKRSGPCTAIIAGDQVYIIDSGSGSSINMNLARIPQGAINAVLLTHFHSDHIDGLGEILLQRWIAASGDASREPTPVYGPPGVETVVEGFNLAYSHDHAYRIEHHGADIIVPSGKGGIAIPFDLPVKGELKTLFEKNGVKVSAILVDHEPVHPAVGYRFDYKNRSIVISGDTKKSANLQALSQGVDVLVHEGLNFDMVNIMKKASEASKLPRMAKIAYDILDYHTSPVEAAEVARDADVGHLLFTHIVPPLPFKPLEEVWLKGVDSVYKKGVTLGKDGTMITLEANSDEIEVKMASPFF